jgi:HPt (histidine-containing phosphotransfer) domain-containing protein
MDDSASDDLEYLAEFERQQFLLYDARRLAAETHSNAVVAAAVTVAALVLSDFSRQDHPRVGWLIAALVALLWTLLLANLARVVSWNTPRWRGGAKVEGKRPSDEVRDTLAAVRNERAENSLRKRAVEHWHARAISAYELGTMKDRRLRLALSGFAAPLAYFAARLIS